MKRQEEFERKTDKPLNKRLDTVQSSSRKHDARNIQTENNSFYYLKWSKH